MLGTSKAGLSPHSPLLTVPLDHGTTILASLEFRLIFQILTSSSFFYYILLIEASCSACACFYLQVVFQTDLRVFPKASHPPLGRLLTAEIFRCTPRWGYCPQIPALGLRIQLSEHKKLKLSTDYLLISGPFINTPPPPPHT